jgi:tetratricopeptide (TPR) repeat protein
LLLQRRKELHRAVGAAIEELYRDRLPEHYAELAHHFTRGEDWSKAMEYGTLAADQSAHAFANTEAIEEYARALEAASKLPLAGAAAVGDLHLKRGEVLSLVGRHKEAFHEYAQALNSARSANDRSRECRVLFGLGWAQYHAHGFEAGLDSWERSRNLAAALGDVEIEASCTAATAWGRATLYGATPEVIEQAEQAVRLVEPLARPQPLAQAKVALGGVLQWQADFGRSVDFVRGALEIGRDLHLGFVIGQSLFFLGHVFLSRGEYEDALSCYQQLGEYAETAGDAFWLARAPNCKGAVPLELYDLDHALELQLEGDETAREYSPVWPEPRGHSLLKAGLVHLERTDYDRAEDFFLRAWGLLDKDDFVRWRWHIPLLHARGALALARRHQDEAWRFATESLELARKTYARKHEVRALRLQGEILAASGHINQGLPLIEASVALAQELQTRRDIWMGRLALAKTLIRLGKDKEAEASLKTAAATIESIAAALKTDSLVRSFLSAAPVLEIFQALGRLPPTVAPPAGR